MNCRLISHNESKICIVENNSTINALLSELDQTSYYINELSKIRSEHRKKEFLALRIALKILLNNENKQIGYTSDGKPILLDGSFKLSFSHCKNWVAVMIHPKNEVGIDIETPSEKLLKIHTRFLGKEELLQYNETKSIEYLRIAWSAKEALYKIIGESAYNFAEQLRLSPFQLAQNGELKAIHTTTNKTYNVRYSLTDNYTLAYCIDY